MEQVEIQLGHSVVVTTDSVYFLSVDGEYALLRAPQAPATGSDPYSLTLLTHEDHGNINVFIATNYSRTPDMVSHGDRIRPRC
jgi:hypothetical protein